MSIQTAIFVYLAIIAILSIMCLSGFIAYLKLYKARLDDRIAYLEGLNRIEVSILELSEAYDYLCGDNHAAMNKAFGNSLQTVKDIAVSLPEL